MKPRVARSTARRLRLVLLVVAVIAPAARAVPAHPDDGRELLEAVRRHYRTLPSYRDHGEIETIFFEDNRERSERHRFTTVARGGGEMRLDLAEASRSEGPGTVLWTEAGGWVFRWDAESRLWGAMDSIDRGAAGVLPPGSAAALVVPALLAGEDPPLLDGAEVRREASRPCGDRQCRVLRLTPPEGPDGERLWGRLWIDPETPRLHRVEVEILPPEPGSAAWVRLALEVDRIGQHAAAGGAEAEPLFLLPPDAVFEEGGWSRGNVEPDNEEALLLFDREVVELPPGPALQTFADVITVSRISLAVRVFDRQGEALKDLRAEDFHLEVGGTVLPVASADWIDFGAPRASTPSAGEPADLGARLPATGPLVVLFVQSAREGFRTLGHLKFRHHLRSLLAALPGSARLAVVAYDVRLKLWQDFTTDRDRVQDAVRKAVYFTAEPEAPAEGDGEPRLLDSWDFEAARRTGFAEDALAVLADTLGELPGDKVVLYLGWGLGEAVAGSFRHAAEALVTADIPLYALDITPGGGHTLARGLARMAKVTGGTYTSAGAWPERAWKRVLRNLDGYYLLLIDGESLPAEGGEVSVHLKDRRWGEVVHPLLSFDRRPDEP